MAPKRGRDIESSRMAFCEVRECGRMFAICRKCEHYQRFCSRDCSRTARRVAGDAGGPVTALLAALTVARAGAHPPPPPAPQLDQHAGFPHPARWLVPLGETLVLDVVVNRFSGWPFGTQTNELPARRVPTPARALALGRRLPALCSLPTCVRQRL